MIDSQQNVWNPDGVGMFVICRASRVDWKWAAGNVGPEERDPR